MSQGRLWVLDLGNTLIKVCLFDEHNDLIHCKPWRDLESLESLFEEAPEAPRWVCSVRDMPTLLEQALRSDVRYHYLSTDTPVPLTLLGYDRKELGCDRLAAAVAASHEHSEVLLINLGTCITYEYLIASCYAGGAISPGLQMRLRALHEFTHQLPRLDLEDIPSAMAHNTRDAMISGALGGAIAEIRGRAHSFLGQYRSAKLILTGGDALWLSPRLGIDHLYKDNMVARGTAIIARHQGSLSSKA